MSGHASVWDLTGPLSMWQGKLSPNLPVATKGNLVNSSHRLVAFASAFVVQKRF